MITNAGLFRNRRSSILILLSLSVLCIGTENPKEFVETIEYMLDPNEQHFAPGIQKNFERPIKKIDCSKLCKNDAYGELFSVSKMEIAKWPVVIIENITEIPEEDDVHYNPRLVENLLLNGWKESTRHLTDPNRGDFTLETHNYAVLIIWDASRKEKMKTIWCPSDGLAWIENHEEDLKSVELSG